MILYKIGPSTIVIVKKYIVSLVVVKNDPKY